MNQMSNCSNIIGGKHRFQSDEAIFKTIENDSLLINNTLVQCIWNNQSDDELLANTSESIYFNISGEFNYSDFDESQVSNLKWIYVIVILFVIAGGLGNVLVCLSVALDKNLQNVTNYFLFSLAVADLLVSLFVMPLSAIPAFLGEFFQIILFHSIPSFILFHLISNTHFNLI
jgi:7 transmembrane receptor (rhodopsin family)